jgi:hypothetical protein
MAEDEDPQIAAVLAKLAGQDAAAAEDARAALEWIAGDQGLVFITQQRRAPVDRGPARLRLPVRYVRIRRCARVLFRRDRSGPRPLAQSAGPR